MIIGVSFFTSNFIMSSVRLRREMKQSKFFDKYYILNEDFLDEDFRKLCNGKRGYGFWAWKPYIILKLYAIGMIRDYDIVFYMDGGCSLKPDCSKRFFEYVELVEKHNFLFFQQNRHIEKKWTKRITLEFFNQSGERLQIDACSFGIKIEKFPLMILNEWLNLIILENFKYSNDNVSDDEIEEFIEHRHDQSILSCIVEKYGLFKIPGETHLFDASFPINATRIKY